VYAGSSRALAQSGARGAVGAITASSNYAWALADGAVSGDWSAQEDLIELVSIIEPHGVPGTKFAASLAGMQPGRSRLPLQPLSSDAEAEIRAAF
jgi:dihydrodipicolinate synthase/N-acetylneuraminate lyase